MFTLASFIQYSFASRSYGHEKYKNQRELKTGKEECKLSLFSDDTILYTEDPKDATRKLLEFTRESGEVAG